MQAGICGGKDGSESIVVSGGYVDDEDRGEEIIYTGQGGNDPGTRRQIADQQLTVGNAGLARSQLEGNPVRVIRGAGGDAAYSPPTGYRYDGLFRVVDHWADTGIDGFQIWRFRLVSLDSIDSPPTDAIDGVPVDRSAAVVQRLIRSTAVANGVKKMHHYRCQVCGVDLTTPTGPYAEAAHIRALGRPHNGPDAPGNVLCLCPNHHALFDAGAIYVEAGLVRDWQGNELGVLRTVPKHKLDSAQLVYHRKHRCP